MKRLLHKKYVTAMMFLMFLFLYSIMNVQKELPLLVDKIKTLAEDGATLKESITGIETVINENVAGRYYFIDGYGYVQRILDKNEENSFEVVKDTEGKLHYTYFTETTNKTSHLAKRTANLKESIKDKDCKLVYVMPPDKYIKGHTTFATGLPYHMANETADQFLNELEAEGVDYIDLRDYLPDSGLNMSEVFFKTDHHWTIETAFWATNTFFGQLQERYGEEIANEAYYEDLSNYNQVVYENCFLGSMGRKSGRLYTEVDDFTLIYPKFPTSFRMESSIFGDMELTGRFEEALVATPVLRQAENPYDTDIYMTYMYGNQSYTCVENLENEDGLNICIIKDSFAVPFAAFSSLRCHNVYMLDPRYYEEDMETFINAHEIDYVVVMFSPQDLVDEFFPFGAEDDEKN